MPTNSTNMPAGPVWVLLAIACGTACGAESSEQSDRPTTVETPPLVPEEATPPSANAADEPRCNQMYDASATPLLTAVFAASDACPEQRSGALPMPSTTITHVTQEEPGRICLNAHVDSGWVVLVLGFDRIHAIFNPDVPPPAIREPLDAAGLGITQLQFTLDTPPASGIQVDLGMVVGPDCAAPTAACLQNGFYAMAADRPGVPISFTEAGTQTLQLSDFKVAPWEDPTLSLDLTRLASVQFELSTGDFDFCVRDFKLLDAAGNQVTMR